MKSTSHPKISNEELWFIQTYLTNLEFKKAKPFIKNHKITKVTELLQSNHNIFKNERLPFLLKCFEDFSKTSANLENSLINLWDLENIMGKKIHEDAPLVLQYSGCKEILKKPLVAIVGSRHPTMYGREQAFRLTKALSSRGCTIISGGAIGIDSIANAVALEQQGGSCAILGSGLNNLYPPSNYSLFNQLKFSKHGLILSEFLEKEPAQKWNFPKRNLTIALLADFVLVIEATFTSGSLITANAALEYGVDIGAIPGNIDCINSEGTNSLIQRGAFCIQKPEDVLERVEYVFRQRNSCHTSTL